MAISLINSNQWIGFYQNCSSKNVLNLKEIPKTTAFHANMFEVISKTFADVLKNCVLQVNSPESSGCEAVCKKNLGFRDFQISAKAWIEKSGIFERPLKELKILFQFGQDPGITFSTANVGKSFFVKYFVDLRTHHPNNTIIFMDENIFIARRPLSAEPKKAVEYDRNSLESMADAIEKQYQTVDPCKPCVLEHFRDVLTDYRKKAESAESVQFNDKVEF